MDDEVIEVMMPEKMHPYNPFNMQNQHQRLNGSTADSMADQQRTSQDLQLRQSKDSGGGSAGKHFCVQLSNFNGMSVIIFKCKLTNFIFARHSVQHLPANDFTEKEQTS